MTTTETTTMHTHEEITAALLAAQEEHGITIVLAKDNYYWQDGGMGHNVVVFIKEPIEWNFFDYGSDDALATLAKAMKAWPKAKAEAIAKQKDKLAELNAE